MTRSILLSPLLALSCLPGLAVAQSAPPLSREEMPRHVVSTGPIGLAINLINAEYEVRTNDHVTVGVGASRLAFGSEYTRDNPYLNSDVFVRYYPRGTAFNGISWGVKVGYTDLPGDGSYLGIGFDANHSTMLNRHVYSSFGLGMKRLFGGSGSMPAIPTLRLNFGVAF